MRLFPGLFLISLGPWSGPVGSVGEHTRGSVPSPDRAIGDPSASPRDFAWRCGIAIEMLSILYGSICGLHMSTGAEIETALCFLEFALYVRKP